MAEYKVVNMQGNDAGTIDLNDAIFACDINEHLMHLAVVANLANMRQGTQKAKLRREVSGGGKKPWKQKGTGNARQGSIRAPQWKGGGVVFAPQPRDYSKTMNKKEKRLALKSALSNAVKDKKLIVVDDITLPEIKTKNVANMLKAFNVKKAFIVLDKNDKNVIYSARNIEDVKTAGVNELNVYDILKYGNVIVTKQAVKNIEEVYA